MKTEAAVRRHRENLHKALSTGDVSDTNAVVYAMASAILTWLLDEDPEADEAAAELDYEVNKL